MNTLQPIPGPARRWWGLPHLAAMKRDYLGFCSRLHHDHGDLAQLAILHERSVELMHPDLLREVMVEQADALKRWGRGPEVFAQLMGQSVLVTEGAVWQRQRRTLMQAFTPRRVAGYAALMVDTARSALDAALPPGQPEGMVAIDTLMSHLTMDVVPSEGMKWHHPTLRANATAFPGSRLLEGMHMTRQRDPAWLAAQYNNRARVPGHGEILARWGQDSAAVRSAACCAGSAAAVFQRSTVQPGGR